MAAVSETPRGPAPVGFYVRDTISGRMMLIDTGAMRSVFPPSREDHRCPPDLAASLTAANGSPILSYGTGSCCSPSLAGGTGGTSLSQTSHKEQLRHIRKVLQHLQESGLVVRFDTCTFGIDKVEFLGHEISPGGVCPVSSKVKAIIRFPTPTSVRAIQEFLGMVNYSRRFIPGITHTMAPLTEILKGRPKTLEWGPDQQRAFSLTKAALTKATALAYQDPSTPLQLTTDASNVACGAILEQVVNGAPQPIAFFSRKLSPTQSCYMQLGIDYEDLTHEQAGDPETPAYCTTITSLKWKDLPLGAGGPTLLRDVSTGQPRPLVPASHHWLVFNVIHGLSHPFGRMMARLLAEKFVWYGIRKDATAWARQCIQCQGSKVGWHTESGVGDFPQPGRRFGHIHVNVVGPLPPSRGARYLLTVVDHSTRWPEATPMEEATSSVCIEALLSSWINQFGVLDHITMDRGPAFLS
ncbi:uncharacterized protein [Macrobrachium rosenbergii]|uniref:uncharacterized protein n=1 Tax=Macrobrachium rosenbergii TaxID=79674 RepID=UPI0034D4B6B7